jgi:predicted ATP-dependent serine protease
MPRKAKTTGTRKPMSPEAKARIAEAVKASAARKRLEMGIAPATGEPVRTRPLELVRMKDQQFDPILFEPMATGKAVDKLFTSDGGIPRATNYMVVGDPGVGKSTVTLDILSDLSGAGQRVLFISAEMTRIDLFGYVKRYPKFGNVDILFLGEYLDDNPKTVIEEALKVGYDVVLIDSFAEVAAAIKETNRMATSATEKFLIDMMLRHNLANNDSKTHTAFLVIQQVTKGGVFVGSNSLKHNLTGMLEIRFDDNGQAAYLMFTKNRRGEVNRKMYFSLKESGDVVYDNRRFSIDEDAREIFEAEKTQIEDDDNSFDRLFGLISE